MAIRFENTRFDSDLTEFDELARGMAAKFGYTAELGLDARLAELLRLRVAQLDPCSYCLILHTAAAERVGIDAETIAHLPSWRESAVFTDAELAALASGEGLTTFELPGFPILHAQLAAHFEAKSIAEIAAVVINMNVWTRLKLAEGAVPVPVAGEETSPDRLG
jgi:AhpD family alkylhydroperoxidase